METVDVTSERTLEEQLAEHMIEFLISTEDTNAIQAAAGLKFGEIIKPFAEDTIGFLAIHNDRARIIELEALADPELLDKYELLQQTLTDKDQEIEVLKSDITTLQNSFDALQAAHRKLLDQTNGTAQ